MTFTPNARFAAVLLAMAAPRLRLMAEAGQQQLRDNLSGSPARSGVQYPGQPNVSAAPGEFPAEQQGNLLASVQDVREVGNRFEMGLTNAPSYAVFLEYYPEAMGGRPFLWRTFHSAQTWARMRQAGGTR